MFGANHKILVSEFDDELSIFGKLRLSISISLSLTFELLNFTNWNIDILVVSEIFINESHHI